MSSQNASFPGNEREDVPHPVAFPVVGVGASAGGLEAFTELLSHLPVPSGMAFVLIQHLDPTHGSALSGLLAKATKMPVKEVTDQMAVEPDHVYVIPPNTNMAIRDGVLTLTPRLHPPHLPIDFFFRALSGDRQEAAIGVILSGTGSDGTLGLAALKEAGGVTFAQEEQSARYGGMPHSAIASGNVEFVLPPAEIARELRESPAIPI